MTIALSAPLPRLKDKNLFRQQSVIGGVWCDASTGRTIEITNPATGMAIGTVPDMSAEDTRRAIEAADAAFRSWRRVPNAERAAKLERWFTLMEAHADDLALILTLEQGKPLSEAKGEITYGASFVKWFAEEARRIEGGIIPAPTSDRKILALKEPVGVSAIITPWNFPNAMITRKVAPALAAGCTVVIKPSDFTPYSALALAVLAERAGIPAGVINILTGLPTEIGAELTSNPLVRKLSFTGSTRVGSLLMAQCAPTVKRLSLELGGNAPFLVFDDADVDAAVEGAIASKFRNGGQTCVCSNRILVQSGIHDAFAAKLSERVAAMKVGSGLAGGRGHRTDDQPSGGGKDRAPRGRRRRQGCKHRRQGRNAGKQPVCRPCGTDRLHHGHAVGKRGNFRPGRPALPLRDGRGSVGHRQRHSLRPCRLFLHSRHGPRLARGRSAGIGHGRPEHRRHLHGRFPLWRRQTIRPWPRGRTRTASRNIWRSRPSTSVGSETNRRQGSEGPPLLNAPPDRICLLDPVP